MFTGLVADIGRIAEAERSSDGARLRIETAIAPQLEGGDSVAVNGVCLTATEVAEEAFEAEVMNQTLRLSSLGGLEPGSEVNLEPALRAADRLGGHIVQGHVDGLAEVIGAEPDGFARRLELAIPSGLERYVIEHGSVALEGISLTVAELVESGFEVSLIPETLERTTLGSVEVGDVLNLEVDLLARYTERLLQGFDERRQR